MDGGTLPRHLRLVRSPPTQGNSGIAGIRANPSSFPIPGCLDKDGTRTDDDANCAIRLLSPSDSSAQVPRRAEIERPRSVRITGGMRQTQMSDLCGGRPCGTRPERAFGVTVANRLKPVDK
jgi:hypothetical protein